MKIAVHGSKNFDNYEVFKRSMAVALSSLRGKHENATVYSAGPHRVNNFVAEFVNISESSMKSWGIDLRFHKVAPQWIEEHASDIDYFIYLSKPHEPVSRLTRQMEDADVEVGIFRY